MTPRRDTAQQRAVRQTIESAGRPLSLREIHELASKQTATLGYRTVSRIIGRMLDDDEVAPVLVPNQPDRYEPADVASTHHHHFRCETCDRVFDINACPGGISNMLPPGFTLAGHEVMLWGQCAECAKKPAQPM